MARLEIMNHHLIQHISLIKNRVHKKKPS